jgi:uncharacterized alpha-E superfamily protein
MITGTPTRTFRNSAEQKLGRLCAELDYTSIDDVLREGFHEFIDRLQIRLNDIGGALQDTLLTPRTSIAPPPPPPAETQIQSQTLGARQRQHL